MALMPSSFGMLMSMVTTSGFNSTAFWSASSPSLAVAATLMSGALANSLLIRFRINAESSATKTRMIDPGLIDSASPITKFAQCLGRSFPEGSLQRHDCPHLLAASTDGRSPLKCRAMRGGSAQPVRSALHG